MCRNAYLGDSGLNSDLQYMFDPAIWISYKTAIFDVLCSYFAWLYYLE